MNVKPVKGNFVRIIVGLVLLLAGLILTSVTVLAYRAEALTSYTLDVIIAAIFLASGIFLIVAGSKT